jgi:transposase-like protein
MLPMHCPKCDSSERVKAGFVKELQRWQCKHCGCKYTRSEPKGLGNTVWSLARELYASGISLRRIGQLIGVSTVAVLKQMRKTDTSQCRLDPQPITVIELDELCTFLTQKNAKYGYGWLFVEKQGESLTGKWVAVALKP